MKHIDMDWNNELIIRMTPCLIVMLHYLESKDWLPMTDTIFFAFSHRKLSNDSLMSTCRQV